MRLTPCDHLYFAHHRLLQRTVGSGNVALFTVGVQGHPDPAAVRSALAAAMLRHPVTLARVAISRLTGRPFWNVPRDLLEAARRGADQAHSFDDLRGVGDPGAPGSRLEGLWRQRCRPDIDLDPAPPVRLEQYALPDDRTLFCLRWPHYLMDAEGALLFLTEIGRLHGISDAPVPPPPGDLPPEIAPDDETIDVLAGRSLAGRLRLFRQGFSLNRRPHGLTIRPLNADARCRLADFGLLSRPYSPDEIVRLQTLAKAQTPPGPALYARYLAGCVIRALHRLYTEAPGGMPASEQVCQAPSDAYLITFPLRVTLRDSAGGILKRRPVPGNYLVSPTLCGLRAIVEDKRALLHDISRQLQTYQQADGDLVQWAMVWMAAQLRASWYPLLFKLPLGFGSLSSGFSYYGEAFVPLRTLGGCPVTNLWGAGPLPNPPGWNPNFCRFRDRLTFSLTWNRPSVPDDLARRYAELIQHEALETG